MPIIQLQNVRINTEMTHKTPAWPSQTAYKMPEAVLYCHLVQNINEKGKAVLKNAVAAFNVSLPTNSYTSGVPEEM